MEKAIEVFGNIAGVLGILICIVSGMIGFFGEPGTIGLVKVETWFVVGVGLMVAACLAKLQLLSSRG